MAVSGLLALGSGSQQSKASRSFGGRAALRAASGAAIQGKLQFEPGQPAAVPNWNASWRDPLSVPADLPLYFLALL